MNKFATELTNIMTPDYMEKLGIKTAPFSDLLSPAHYYENDNKIDIQKKIAHLLEYTNLVLFIQGAKGAGKTTTIKQRILTAKEDWAICYLSAKDYTSADTFIEKLKSDFKLGNTPNSTSSATEQLQQQLNVLRNTGKLPVLIIDDIEKLNKTLIPVLSPLIALSPFTALSPPQENTQPPIRLIISGEDLPIDLLTAIPKENNESHIKYLPALPLSASETGDYLNFRMTASGVKKNNLFNPKAINDIYLESKGFPEKINHLANQWLSARAHGGKKKSAAIFSGNNKALKLAVIGLALLIVIFIFSINSSNTTDKPLASENKTLAIPDKHKITEPTRTTKTAAETNAEKNHSVRRELISRPPPLILKEEKVPKTKEKTLPPIEKKASQTSQEEIDTPLTKAPLIKKKKTFNTTEWINNQNSAFFTLQLISGTNKSSLEKFIKKHKIENDAHIFSTIRGGKPWHSVIYKSYRVRKSAQAAANKLPSELKKTQPWIRTFGHIKRDIK